MAIDTMCDRSRNAFGCRTSLRRCPGSPRGYSGIPRNAFARCTSLRCAERATHPPLA